MATQLKNITPGEDPLDLMSLPGWLYFDPEYFEAEKKAFLRSAPQIVCHESEIREPGDWRSLEYLGESVIVMRIAANGLTILYQPGAPCSTTRARLSGMLSRNAW